MITIWHCWNSYSIPGWSNRECKIRIIETKIENMEFHVYFEFIEVFDEEE